MNNKPVKTIGSNLIADVFNASLEIGVGYLYFIALRKISPWIKFPVLIVANGLLVTGINACIKKSESMHQYCSKESR